MAEIKIHGGDFSGTGSFFWGTMTLKSNKNPFWGESIPATELEFVEIVTEENIKKLGGTLGRGIVGGALLGPVGLLAGMLTGGRKKEITFIAKLKDGRQFIATTDKDTFVKLKGASTPTRDFSTIIAPETEITLDQMTKKCPLCAETIKLEAKKCRYCGEIFDPEEVENAVRAHRSVLAEERDILAQELARRAEGQSYCPGCDRWDIYPNATLPGGGIGPWCPTCSQPAKDSLKRCPRCRQWDVLEILVLPNGIFTFYCPYCKKPVPK